MATYKVNPSSQSLNPAKQPKPIHGRIFITAEEKKAIGAMLVKGEDASNAQNRKMMPEDVLRVQRDQALARVQELSKELKHWEATVKQLQRQLDSVSVLGLIRMKIARWILP